MLGVVSSGENENRVPFESMRIFSALEAPDALVWNLSSPVAALAVDTQFIDPVFCSVAIFGDQ